MPAKCGGCGKFVSATDTTRCVKCGVVYHRTCVGLPAKGPTTTIGQCPECRRNVRRDNKADTPVRGLVAELQTEEPASVSVTTPPAVMTPADLTGLVQPTTPLSTVAPLMPLAAAASLSPIMLGMENTDLAKVHPDFPQDVGSALKMVVEELRTLRFEVLELRKDVAGLKASNDSCHTRMDGMEARLEAIEKLHDTGSVPSTAVSEMESEVRQLKRDLNERDQELISNDLVVANVPESKAENLTHLFLLIATKLGVALDERDIVSAERVGGRLIKATSPTVSTEPRPRAIMVRLARRDQRDAVLNGARVRRGATTENLGLAGNPVRFYVNERLTKLNQQLFRQARAAAEIHGWRFVWTKRGRILVRNKPGDATLRITSAEDIQQFIGPYTDNNK